MQVIINDASCFELRKAGLLHVTLLLPHQFLIALPLLRSPLLGFSPAEIADLTARGLVTVDVPPEGVKRAIELRGICPALSFCDCLSIAMAEGQVATVLLAEDACVCGQAKTLGIEIRGVFWVCDDLENCAAVAAGDLHSALIKLQGHRQAFAQEPELDMRITRVAARAKEASAASFQ